MSEKCPDAEIRVVHENNMVLTNVELQEAIDKANYALQVCRKEEREMWQNQLNALLLAQRDRLIVLVRP